MIKFMSLEFLGLLHRIPGKIKIAVYRLEISALVPKQGRGGSNFPYILLNEIQTMFSQLAKQPWRHQSADSCTAREHDLSSEV